MRKDEFKTWLKEVKKVAQGPISNYPSRCSRVERTLKLDLDEEFKKDKGHDLLELLADSDNGALTDRLEFSEGADIPSGLASLRSAVNSYFEFCLYLQKLNVIGR